MAELVNSCKKHQYFENNVSVGFQNNAVIVNGDEVAGFNFEVFNPFIITNYAGRPSGQQTPNGGIGNSTLFFADGSVVQTFPFQLLSQSMLSANITGANQSGKLSYTPNNSGENFFKYLKRYLNDDLIPKNFATFLMPHFTIDQFWNMAAIPVQPIDWLNMIDKLKNLIDWRMMLPPGKYTIVGSAGGNIDGYFAPFKNVFNAVNLGGANDAYLITLELKSIE